LAGVSPVAVVGDYYRSVALPYASSPLSGFGSTQRGGRYNRKGTFEAYYLSASPRTALYEVNALVSGFRGRTPAALPGRAMITVSAQLSRVLDLTDRDVRAEIGVTKEDLFAPWLLDQNAGRFPLTQRIGKAAYDALFEAILAPSDAHRSGVNLVVIYATLQQTSSLTDISGIHRPGATGVHSIRGRLSPPVI
jgi:RES domain-containing protein